MLLRTLTLAAVLTALTTGTFAGITNGNTCTFGGQGFQAIYMATDFELMVTAAVPEPAI